MPFQSEIKRTGSLLVVSGPSGAGKSTVCRPVVQEDPNLHFSISCTTRPMRTGETDGVDYHFVGREEFERRVAAGDFLEHAEVHGNFYGTLKQEVQQYLQQGQDVLLDIDVQGARLIRQNVAGTDLADSCVYIFMGPPSRAILEKRLRGRGTDADEVIARRLRNAEGELAAWGEYDYLIITYTPESAIADLRSILATARLATPAVDPKSLWPDG